MLCQTCGLAKNKNRAITNFQKSVYIYRYLSHMSKGKFIIRLNNRWLDKYFIKNLPLHCRPLGMCFFHNLGPQDEPEGKIQWLSRNSRLPKINSFIKNLPLVLRLPPHFARAQCPIFPVFVFLVQVLGLPIPLPWCRGIVEELWHLCFGGQWPSLFWPFLAPDTNKQKII